MNDEDLILQVQEASVAAWNRGDLSAHLALYDASVTTMSGNGPRHGVAPVEAAFRDRYFHGAASRPALHVEQVALRFLGPDTALMTGRYQLSGGEAPDASGWFTLVWQRMAAGWKAVHDHAS